MIKESTLINVLREFGINIINVVSANFDGKTSKFNEDGIKYQFYTCNISLTYYTTNSNINEVYLSYPGNFNISFLKISYSPTNLGYSVIGDKISYKKLYIDEIFDYIFEFISRFDKDFRRNYRLIKLGI
jgi:hypothetical protein